MSAINNRLDIFGEIHKRTVLFDNEVKKEIQTVGQSLEYGDRFIPRRNNNKPASAHVTDKSDDCAKANGVYADLLRGALGLKARRQLILNDHAIPRPFFSNDDAPDDLNFIYYPRQCVVNSPTRYKDLDWMCKPRKKNKVDVNSSHEFEGFAGTIVGTQIEWTWTGHIVSYCDNSLLLWKPSEPTITKYDLDNVVTLAYHPNHRFLATSNQNKVRPSVNVWFFRSGAMLNCFNHRPKDNFMVTTLCWHRHGFHLLTGNIKGMICTLDFYGSKELFHRTPSVHKMIKDIKFSATGQYVASLDIIGRLCIWSYNSGYLQLHHTWDSWAPSKVAFDWHPWTDFDIVACLSRGSVVIVLNILSKQIEAYSSGNAFKFERPVVSFNRISAELVVSCQRKARNGFHKNILVMGAVDQILDEIQDVGAVDTGFMWSPNNEQLAFVAGNDIQIFNFFGLTTTSTGASTTTAPNLAANVCENNFSIFKKFEFIK